MKSFADAANWIEKKINTLEPEFMAAENKSIQAAESIFVKQSSGTMSASRRRMLGYPYAAAHPNGSVDPGYVNVGLTGNFKRSWQVHAARMAGGRSSASVVNTSPESEYMFGTVKMVMRPIDKRVAMIVRPIRLANARAALRRALNA